MKSISIAGAKAHLGELIDQVQEGGSVLITRRGKHVARLTAVERPREPVNVGQLRALTQSMPKQPESAGEFVRKMRDDERY